MAYFTAHLDYQNFPCAAVGLTPIVMWSNARWKGLLGGYFLPVLTALIPQSALSPLESTAEELSILRSLPRGHVLPSEPLKTKMGLINIRSLVNKKLYYTFLSPLTIWISYF